MPSALLAVLLLAAPTAEAAPAALRTSFAEVTTHVQTERCSKARRELKLTMRSVVEAEDTKSGNEKAPGRSGASAVAREM